MSWLFYILIVICMLACLASGICFWPICVVVCLTAIFGCYCERRQIFKPRLFKAIGIISYFLFCVCSILMSPTLHVMVLGVFLNIVWALVEYRALNHKKSSDRVQLGILALLPMICVSLALSASEFLLFLLAYFIVLFLYLAQQSLLVPSSGSVATTTQSTTQIAHYQRRFWGRFGLLCLGALVIGCAMFLVIPRYNPEPVSGVPGVEQPTGGMPDVELDKTGTIELDPSLLFRAQVPQRDAFYWRIDIQNHFDGTKWRTRGYYRDSSYTFSDEEYQIPAHRVEFVHDWKDYRIPTLMGASFLYHLPETEHPDIRLSINAYGIFRRYGWNKTQPFKGYMFWFEEENGTGRGVFAFELTVKILRQVFHMNAYQTDVKDSLYRPQMIWPGRRKHTEEIQKRLKDLALSITESATTDRERAELISDYLKTNYQYSLNRPVREGNIVEDFLFKQKFGHCEVFSTTMAVLVSLLDIPVHNVTGFLSTEYSDGYNNVRASHAHSWVEVYLDGKWVVFDPTPSSESQQKIGLLQRIDDWFSTYRADDFYHWVSEHSLWISIILLMILLGMITRRPCIQYIKARTLPVNEVRKRAWEELMTTCAANDKYRRASTISLEQWWAEDNPEFPKIQKIAREYISARYVNEIKVPETFFGRWRENSRIIREYKL